MTKLRPTVSVASVILALATIPANAMSMPPMTVVATQSTPIIKVRDRGHGHDHWHHGHRRDHRFHGSDSYYDRNDESGMLFKSFVTGTLFR